MLAAGVIAFEELQARYIERAREAVGEDADAARIVVLSDAALPIPEVGGVLRVGGWCRADLGGAGTLPNPADDRSLLEPLEALAWRTRSQAVRGLTPVLNRHHGVDLPPRYWDLLLGLWLLDTVSTTIDRLMRCAAAHEIAPDARFAVAPPGSLPVLQSEGVRGYVTDWGNATLMSRLAAVAGFPTVAAARVAEAPPEHRVPDTGRLRDRIGAIPAWLTGLALARRKGGVVLLGSSQFTQRELIALRRRAPAVTLGTRAGLRHRVDWIAEPPAVDTAARSTLADLEATTVVERLLAGLLPDLLPVTALEAYPAVVAESERRYGPPSPAVHGNYSHDEVENEFLARSRAAGRRLVFAQHGGAYRQLRVNAVERLELHRDSTFASWGWAGPGARPTASPHLSRLRDTHRGGDSVLVVELLMPRYLQRYVSHPIAEQAEALGEDLLAFVRAVRSPDVSSRLILKRSIAKEIYDAERHPEIEHLPHTGEDGPRAPWWMERSRAVVVTYPDTTFIEAMVMNVPTIGFWNPERFELRDDAAPFFKALADLGVVFSEPKAAASALERIYDRADEWWRGSEIQQARHAFVDRFGRCQDWLADWAETIGLLRREPPGGGARD